MFTVLHSFTQLLKLAQNHKQLKINKINNNEFNKINFDNLTPLYPEEKLALEIDDSKMLKDILNGKKVKINMLLPSPLVSDTKEYFLTNKGKIISLGIVEGIFFKPRKVLY